jgi:hypothetical protein
MFYMKNYCIYMQKFAKLYYLIMPNQQMNIDLSY